MSLLLMLIFSAFMAYIGSFWIDRLYKSSLELSFPNEILLRSRYRKYFLFLAFMILFSLAGTDYFKIMAIYLLVLMTITDFEQYMLFDVMTMPLAFFGAFYAWVNDILLENFIAAIIGGGFFLLLTIITRGALGGGDVKLIFGLGFYLGAEKLLDVVLYGSIFGGLAGLTMILTKKKDRKSYFAYGPYFTLTAIYFLLK